MLNKARDEIISDSLILEIILKPSFRSLRQHQTFPVHSSERDLQVSTDREHQVSRTTSLDKHWRGTAAASQQKAGPQYPPPILLRQSLSSYSSPQGMSGFVNSISPLTSKATAISTRRALSWHSRLQLQHLVDHFENNSLVRVRLR